MEVVLSVTDGISSLMEMNAVAQWRSTPLFTTTWSSGTPNLLHHRSFEENILQGVVRVELWVGQCGGVTLGDARTGFASVSWIMIEDLSRPQS